MDIAFEDKIGLIEYYIKELDSAIQSRDINAAESLRQTIVGVFSSEIKDITDHLHAYAFYHDMTQNDYIDDAKMLKSILQNYRINLGSGLFKVLNADSNGVTVTQSVNQDVSNEINITLESTFEQINNLPSDVLSDADKEVLSGKLAGISSEKDSKKRWDKVKSVLKYIAEQGIEVGKAALPFVLKMIMEAH